MVCSNTTKTFKLRIRINGFKIITTYKYYLAVNPQSIHSWVWNAHLFFRFYLVLYTLLCVVYEQIFFFSVARDVSTEVAHRSLVFFTEHLFYLAIIMNTSLSISLSVNALENGIRLGLTLLFISFSKVEWLKNSLPLSILLFGCVCLWVRCDYCFPLSAKLLLVNRLVNFAEQFVSFSHNCC